MNKIHFDIRLRPEIESGKYKVLFADRPARIICWDKKSSKDGSIVVALVDDGKSEHTEYFYADGNSICENSPALFIVPVEPEPTAFESRLCEILDFAWKHKDTIKTDGDIIADAKRLGPELLSLARNEIVKSGYAIIEGEHYLEEGRKNYERGKAEALKDLPRWRKCADCTPKPACSNEWIFSIDSENVTRESAIVHNGYFLPLDGLEKLPKEDEK